MSATPERAPLGHGDVADGLAALIESYRSEPLPGDAARLLDGVRRVLLRMEREISTSTEAGSPVPASMLRRYVIEELREALRLQAAR